MPHPTAHGTNTLLLGATGTGLDPRVARLVESAEAPVARGKRHDDTADRSVREQRGQRP